MNVIAIDTSTRDLSLALARDGKIVKYKNAITSKDLARELPQLLKAFLKEAGISLEKLNAIVLGLGPGSFTGLRVGASAAKAFAFGLGIPIYGVSSLDAIAYHMRKKAKKICVLVDARRSLFYGSSYSSDGSGIKRTSDYGLNPLEDFLKKCLSDTLIVGDGCALIETKKKKGLKLAAKAAWKPQARNLLPLLQGRIKEGQGDDAASLVPIYLYPEDCQAVRREKAQGVEQRP